MSELTAARLRELLSYDPETGVFTWRVKRKQMNVGDVAGCIVGKRYRTLTIDCVTYLAHRLAWFHYYGRWPSEYIDHIDQDGFNNRIANLREASPKQNTHNRRGDSTSKSGIKGVCFRARHNKWEANIMCAGIARYLGQFKTSDEAAAAYRTAALELHRDFAREA